ncbi:MAG TPA: hypothetical protein VIY48_08625 [Candidatus Paceibacterota bacterium]
MAITTKSRRTDVIRVLSIVNTSSAIITVGRATTVKSLAEKATMIVAQFHVLATTDAIPRCSVRGIFAT